MTVTPLPFFASRLCLSSLASIAGALMSLFSLGLLLWLSDCGSVCASEADTIFVSLLSLEATGTFCSPFTDSSIPFNNAADLDDNSCAGSPWTSWLCRMSRVASSLYLAPVIRPAAVADLTVRGEEWRAWLTCSRAAATLLRETIQALHCVLQHAEPKQDCLLTAATRRCQDRSSSHKQGR